MNWPPTPEESAALRKQSEEESRFVWAPWKKFRSRLSKIGIDLEADMNVPWIYLRQINGNKVKAEPFLSEGRFTMAWFPIHKGKQVRLTDRRKVFQTIRANLGWRGFIGRIAHLVRAANS